MHQEHQALRADIYALLASLFRSAPSAELLDFLQQMEIDTSRSNPMTRGWQLLQLAARQANPEMLEDEYLPLFIGIGQGDVTPFASWYLTGSIMEAPLIELRKDLKILGFEREESSKEPEDHVAALCEVMSLLIQQGASAERQATFFNRHLAGWVEALCKDVQQAPSAVFYQAVAELAEAFFQQEKLYQPATETQHSQVQAVQLFSPAG
ncbi:TorD/DmsD family molecular chaperone [Marinospirillum alkaliphilum]|uniref:Chaperone TorD involved in molybdoenzyme TorA maturation n=1 Tax=Marinospirillum alkaliphilum DSM 21637 TaxID=1122209 RepID=A0A1K1Y1X0_9GAMM|nr:molecular chaperone TorD family protein [Marinospirillum alkaliphilum]SFX55268.1 chaperone TorD involved in molybdoenzyme TorA maturation [Marinospirillum alkaliphilum DSM 21637]